MKRAGLCIAVLLATFSSARAEWQGDPYAAPAGPSAPAFDGALEARGCYWYRQRQTCGRYCYVEVNGKRYCQERQHDAHPQAPEGESAIVVPETYGPMKLGADPRRRRN